MDGMERARSCFIALGGIIIGKVVLLDPKGVPQFAEWMWKYRSEAMVPWVQNRNHFFSFKIGSWEIKSLTFNGS